LDEDKLPPAKSFMNLLNTGMISDFSGNEFILSGELKFLQNNGGVFKTVTKKLNYSIQLTKEINLPGEVISDNKIIVETKIIETKVIKDHSENEIISATKFSVYSQCPLKYDLIYQKSFNKLIEEQRSWDKRNWKAKRFEFNDSENISLSMEDQIPSDRLSSDLKGKIIHKILERNPTVENLSELISITFSSLPNPLAGIDSIQSIKDELESFLESEEYNYLSSFRNFYNEYEIYLKQDNFYLLGIIDKLIIEDDKIIIVDYKTDNINETEIADRAGIYKNQLLFYSYILKEYFKSAHKIESRIEFIKHPNKRVIFQFDEKNRLEINQKLKDFIKNLRTNNFNPNLDHCSNCVFSNSPNKCVAIS
jgi:PD-(D/E)XK nuclease superfamily